MVGDADKRTAHLKIHYLPIVQEGLDHHIPLLRKSQKFSLAEQTVDFEAGYL